MSAATAPRIRLACADSACPCRHAQAPGVDTWIGPDSSVRGVIEISAPADIRAVVLPAAALARSRWFVHRTGDMEASA